MVVVSGSRVKNVATYPSSTPPVQQSPVTLANNNNNNSSTCLSSTSSSTTGDGSSTMVILAGGTTMAVAGSGGAVVAVARAELICRPNSYHFQERVLSLSEPAKVGRSVARARACHDNAIFDCKVLSRNHAMLWYDAGKFYLQDTNSSNGTFVNNNRLPSNESQPHEVNSGDIVQFGVDVVENCKKVTHGCIIATLKLYLPDGKEAKASPSIVERSRQCVPLDELYKLNQIIQEACQREFWLESKLSALQLIVDQARKAADESWQAYVGEERLLSRVATLENQLLQASKGSGEDQLKEELNKLQKDKSKYQIAAKESLNKLRGELLEAIISTNEQQRARATAEHEAIYAKDQLEQTQQELQQLAKKLIYEQEQTNECRMQLKDREKELLEKLEQETQQVFDLKKSLEELRLLGLNSNTDVSEKYHLICKDDFKTKEEMIAAENEAIEERVDDLNKSNGVVEPQENNKNLKEEIERPYYTTEGSELTESNNSSSNTDENVITENNTTDSNLIEEIKLESEESSISSSDDEDISQITINPPSTTLESPLPPPPPQNTPPDNSTNSQLEKHSLDETTVENPLTQTFTSTTENSVNTVDSKTLKYHMASVHQNEYRRQIDELQLETSVGKVRESALVGELNRAKSDGAKTRRELDEVRRELAELRLQQREMCNETQRLRDRVRVLREEEKETGKVKDESPEKEEESKEKKEESKKKEQSKEKKDESKQVKEESKEKKDEVKEVKEESKQVMEKSKVKKEESIVKKEESRDKKEESKDKKEDSKDKKEDSKDKKEDSKDKKEDSKEKKMDKSKETKEKDNKSEDGLENREKVKGEEKLRISDLDDSANIMSTSGENNMMSASSCTTLSVADVANLESELIALKERYAQINDEKVTLNRKLATLHDQYNTLCNKSYNTMFYYIAPLVFMVIYLLVSSMFS